MAARLVPMPPILWTGGGGGNMAIWHHGTEEKQWKDSGWVFNGKFYPVEYSDDPNGPDKVLGRELIEKDFKLFPEKYPAMLQARKDSGEGGLQ